MPTQVSVNEYVQEKLIELIIAKAQSTYVDASGTGHGYGHEVIVYTDDLSTDSRTPRLMKEVPHEALNISHCPIISIGFPETTDHSFVSSLRQKDMLEVIVTVIDHHGQTHFNDISARNRLELLTRNLVNIIQKYIYPKLDTISVYNEFVKCEWSEVQMQEPNLLLQGIVINIPVYYEKGRKFYI